MSSQYSACCKNSKGGANAGAIGGRFAAERYGLNILYEGIEDDKSNVTRFLSLEKKARNQPGRIRHPSCSFLKTDQAHCTNVFLCLLTGRLT
jgi:prephenate dehydratase